MLTSSELKHYFFQHNISQNTAALIQDMRNVNRYVMRAASSETDFTDARYTCRSAKMRGVIYVASGLGRAGFNLLETDPNTYEFWHARLPIVFPSLKSAVSYFRIGVEGAGWETWVEEEELSLRAVVGSRFERDADGTWRYLEAERNAGELGLYWRVRSSREINWDYICNLEFLRHIRQHGDPGIDEGLASCIATIVQSEQGIKLSALADTAGALWARQREPHAEEPASKQRADDASVAYTVRVMLVSDRLYTDLHKASLADSQRVRVYTDRAAYEALGDKAAYLSTQPWPSARLPIFIRADEAHFDRRWHYENVLRGVTESSETGSLIIPIPEPDKRARKLGQELLPWFVAQHFRAGKHRTPLATYLDYARECARQGLKPVSERTFARRIREYASNPDNRPSKGPQHRFGENAQTPSMVWRNAVERFFQGANTQFVRAQARPLRFHTRHVTCAVANGKPTRHRPRFSIGTKRVKAQRTLMDEG